MTRPEPFMRTIFSSVFAALLAVAMPSLAHALPAEAEVSSTVPREDAGSLIAAELGLDVPAPIAQGLRELRKGAVPATVDAVIIARPPDVPDAAEVLASEEQRHIAAALDATLFADPNEGETEMLVAQDLASLTAETTGSVGSISPEPKVTGEADLLP
jgi:hypothetical protein